LGRLFDITDRKQGITPLLTRNEVSLKDLKSQIIPSGVNENLDLLLAGPVPPNPTEMLARETFGQIIALLRENYDYVIFDTAPVGLVTDTLEIARHADVSVVICRADYTPRSSFGIINALAKDNKLPNACVVLNGIDMSRRKYGYYYGYGRYGKYGRYGYGRYGYGRYGYSRYGYSNYGSYGSYGQYGRYADSHYGDKEDNSVKK
jgi:capsular exopolysaccharide synthesis family protein